MSASPIPFVREMTANYEAIEQVSPLIRRVLARNPSPFTYLGTNTYIIGHGEVAVIDPGPALPEHITALETLLAGERISHILVTHTHLDHSPAARPLQQTQIAAGAKIYGYEIPASEPTDALAEDVKLEEDADADFAPDIAMQHGDKVSGKGWDLEAVWTPGHVSNHLCFALPQEKALITGDHVMGWSTSVIIPPDGSMADYMNSLDLLLARDDAVFWPAHGPPIRDPKSFTRALIAHRQMREAQLVAQLKAGQTHIPAMVAVIYADTDKRLHGAAALSALSHLQHMEAKGMVRHDGASGKARAYYLTD